MLTKRREMVMIAAGILIISAFVWAIFAFISSATMTITTNDLSNNIFVTQKLSEGTNQINLTQVNETASVRVSAGDYIVTVKNNYQSVSQIVKLGFGEHKSLSINLVSSLVQTATEPVSSFGAGSIIASKDVLRFVDRNSSERPLYTVNANNAITKLSGGNTYLNVYWADPSFGIGLVTDKNNQYQIVKIDGNNVTNVNLPFSASETTGYGVAPNRAWFVSDGHIVYKANGDGSFTKVYTTNESVGIKSVSNDAILLTQKNTKNIREGNLIILHNNGDKYQINGESYESAWSPSGDKLVTSGDTSELYDSKLNKIGILPDSNFNSPVWLDDNTLLYGVSGNIWSYDLKAGKASVIASIDQLTGIFSQIIPSVDGGYIYTSIQKGGNRSNIAFRLDRIPLQGQPVSGLPSQKFSLLIPNRVGGCDLNYMKFAQFSIIIKPVTSSNCMPAIQKYLGGYNIPLTGISFQQLP